MGRPPTFRGLLRKITRHNRRVARLRERLSKMEREAEPVSPCPECGSIELCLPDCHVAPWNMEPEPPTTQATSTAGSIPMSATPVNETRFKSLDVMARDPRIVRIWDEDGDGLWAELAPGFNFDGSSCLHEWTVRALLRSWRTNISTGPTY